MASLNKVMMIGRLTKDPELRYLPNGTPKAELRLATSREWTGRDGEKQKQTCYIDVVVWSRQAEIAKQWLRKGRQVFVEGRLDFQEWEGKDGQKRSKHQIVAEALQFLDRGEGGPNGGGPEEIPAEGEAPATGSGGYAGGQQRSGGYGGGGYGGGGGGYGGGGYGGNGGNGGRAYGKTSGGTAPAAPQGADAPHEDGPPDEPAPIREAMGVGDNDLPF